MSGPATPADGAANRPRGYGLSVFTIALGVRLCWILYGPWMGGDSREYLRLARSLVTHGTFSYDGVTPTAFRPPLYPAFLALLWHGPRPPFLAVYLTQAASGAATALIVYAIASRAFNRTAGLVAGLLVACGPMAGRYTATVLTETTFTFLLVAGVLLWGRGRWLAAGVALGVATLERAVLLPFLLALLVLAVWPRLRRIPDVSCGARAALVALVVIAPWIARNTLVVGHPTVAEAGWTDNLVLGTVRLHTGENPWTQLLRGVDVVTARTGDTGRMFDGDAAPTAIDVLRYVARHPGDWLLARLSQYPRLFIGTGDYLLTGRNNLSFAAAWRTGRPVPILIKAGFVIGNVAFLLLAVWGFLRQPRPLTATLHVWAFPVFLIVAQLPMYAEPRYGLPMTPLLAVFAGLTLTAQWSRGREPDGQGQAAPTPARKADA